MLCVHFSNEKHSSVKRKEWILLQGFVEVCHKWAVNVWAYGACFGGSFSLSPRLFYFLLNYTKLSSWCIVHWLDRNAWQYVKFANEGERIAFKQSVAPDSSHLPFIDFQLFYLEPMLATTNSMQVFQQLEEILHQTGNGLGEHGKAVPLMEHTEGHALIFLPESETTSRILVHEKERYPSSVCCSCWGLCGWVTPSTSSKGGNLLIITRVQFQS